MFCTGKLDAVICQHHLCLLFPPIPPSLKEKSAARNLLPTKSPFRELWLTELLIPRENTNSGVYFGICFDSCLYAIGAN